MKDKKKQIEKKLVLTKETIAKLETVQLNAVRGGGTDFATFCICVM